MKDIVFCYKIYRRSPSLQCLDNISHVDSCSMIIPFLKILFFLFFFFLSYATINVETVFCVFFETLNDVTFPSLFPVTFELFNYSKMSPLVLSIPWRNILAVTENSTRSATIHSVSLDPTLINFYSLHLFFGLF